MAQPCVLDTDECRALLESGVFGRVSFVAPEGLQIIPLNYAVFEDRIVFRTSAHSLLGRHGPGQELAFEVDHVDYEYHLGWSVVAHGVATPCTDPADVEAIYTHWRPMPWASGERDLLIGLRWHRLTGRLLGPRRDPRRDRPVARVRTLV